MATSNYWPSMSEFQEAVQSPRQAFASVELQNGTPVTNKLGLPKPVCGTFASVYELESGPNRWATKCFLRNIPDQHERYAVISNHLRQCRLRYFVRFEYQAQGIRVRGQMFPIVQMEWVQGEGLDKYIERHLEDRRKLAKLGKRWTKLLKDLRSAKIAHGDLQHGNVLVLPNGQLRLIDYDGMWVPALRGQQSHETGHPAFQSPERTAGDFHADIDQFAGLVIQIAIRALRLSPGLWKKYYNGDNLVLRRQDLLDSENSPVVADLRSLGDREIATMLEDMIRACGARPRAASMGGGTSLPAERSPKRTREKATATTKRQPAGVSAGTQSSGGPTSSAQSGGAATGARAAGAPSWLSDHVPELSERPSQAEPNPTPTPQPAPASGSAGAVEPSAATPPRLGTFVKSLFRILFR